MGVEGANIDLIIARDAFFVLRELLRVIWGLIIGSVLAGLYVLAGHDVVFQSQARTFLFAGSYITDVATVDDHRL